MEPFDRHPADLGVLEETAAELTRLANQAIDQRAATLAAFDPAEDGWRGVAAAELRAAPSDVRNDAFEVSGAVAWGSVPLRYWASKVSGFNLKAAHFEASCAAEMAGIAMPDDPSGSPSVALQVDTARAAVRRRWEEAWQRAYDTDIVDGAETTARMYRDGPTAENLHEARGLLPGVGASVVFPQLWHRNNMREAAGDAVELARRILADGDPSERDLQRLNDLLAEYGRDEAFAHYLMTELGPDGLLDLTADVALIQHDDAVSRGGHPDSHLATLIGSIQGGLGIALATATNRNGPRNGYDLDDEWVDQLLTAGDQRVQIDGTDYAPYGYQVLGVLVSNDQATFDAQFLARVGGGMLDFERDHGGSDVWFEPELDIAGDESAGIRLNWIDGFGADAPAGIDPMSGLMAALDNNDAAAREFFTERVPEGEHSRIRYLLTERDWFQDTPFRSDDPERVPNGIVSLGRALEGATWDTSNEDAATIVRRTVTAVGDDGVVNDYLRGPLAEVTARWIDSMYHAMEGHDPATNLDDAQVAPFLQELGRDSDARLTVIDAASGHGLGVLNQEFVNGTPERADVAILPTAEVLRALDVGSDNQAIEVAQREQERVTRITELGKTAIGLIPEAGSTANTIISVTGLDDAITGHFDQTDELNDNLAETHAATRDTLEGLFWAASAANGGPENADQALSPEHADDWYWYAQMANAVAQTYVTGRQD